MTCIDFSLFGEYWLLFDFLRIIPQSELNQSQITSVRWIRLWFLGLHLYSEKSLFEWIWIWNCKCESILRCIWLLDKSKKTWGTDNNNSLSFSLFIMCFYHSHVINSKVFEFSLFSTKLKSIKAVKIDMIIWDKLRYPIFGWPNELTCWEIFIRIQKTLLILYEWIQYTHIV